MAEFSGLPATSLTSRTHLRRERKGEMLRGSSRKRTLDRVYGKFSCKICHKKWESAHVYTDPGTKKVLYKQKCKTCDGDEAYCFPYDQQLLKCSKCNKPGEECRCTCDSCGKLRYRPRGKMMRFDDEEKYCRCDRRNLNEDAVGTKIDKSKSHRAELCEKCQSGLPCGVEG